MNFISIFYMKYSYDWNDCCWCLLKTIDKLFKGNWNFLPVYNFCKTGSKGDNNNNICNKRISKGLDGYNLKTKQL